MKRESPLFPWVWRALFAGVLALFVAPTQSAWAKGKPAAVAKKKPPKGKEKAPAKEAPKEEAGEAAAEAPAAPSPAAGGAGAGGEESRALQRGERVEFDGRLIQGQTAKAGAVYLFARVATNLTSMVNAQSSFREKIIRTVYPNDDEAEARTAAERAESQDLAEKKPDAPAKKEKEEASKDEEKKDPEPAAKKEPETKKKPGKDAARSSGKEAAP